MRLAAGLVVAVVAVAVVAGGCGGPGGDVAEPGPGWEPLAGAVPAPALPSLVDALELAALRCPDLVRPRRAAAQVVVAARTAGLGDDEVRWVRAAAGVASGVAAHADGEPCGPELAGWMAVATVAPTIPTPTTRTTTSTTTTTTAPAGEVPTVDQPTFEEVEVGMTLREVQERFGSPGRSLPVGLDPRHDDRVYRWPGCCHLFAQARVHVRDGVVVAVSGFNLSDPPS